MALHSSAIVGGVLTAAVAALYKAYGPSWVMQRAKVLRCSSVTQYSYNVLRPLLNFPWERDSAVVCASWPVSAMNVGLHGRGLASSVFCSLLGVGFNSYLTENTLSELQKRNWLVLLGQFCLFVVRTTRSKHTKKRKKERNEQTNAVSECYDSWHMSLELYFKGSVSRELEKKPSLDLQNIMRSEGYLLRFYSFSLCFLQPWGPINWAALYTATRSSDGTGALWGVMLLAPSMLQRVWKESEGRSLLLATSGGRQGSTAVTHRCTEAEQAAWLVLASVVSKIVRRLAQICHSSGHKSVASHSGKPVWTPGQYLWDLWWTKWQWQRLLSNNFGFPVIIITCIIAQMFHTSSC
jgi:hypothetical protein